MRGAASRSRGLQPGSRPRTRPWRAEFCVQEQPTESRRRPGADSKQTRRLPDGRTPRDQPRGNSKPEAQSVVELRGLSAAQFLNFRAHERPCDRAAMPMFDLPPHAPVHRSSAGRRFGRWRRSGDRRRDLTVWGPITAPEEDGQPGQKGSAQAAASSFIGRVATRTYAPRAKFASATVSQSRRSPPREHRQLSDPTCPLPTGPPTAVLRAVSPSDPRSAAPRP